MDPQMDMELQLWEYIDGFADAGQRARIERLLAEQAEWRAKYEELLQTHQLLSFTELEQPSLRFTRNVMEAIAREQIAPASRQYINNRIIWGIGIFFLTLILGLLAYGIEQVDWAAGKTPNTMGIDFNKVDYSALSDNQWMNAFLGLNIILGLFLLDRALSARREEQMRRLHP